MKYDVIYVKRINCLNKVVYSKIKGDDEKGQVDLMEQNIGMKIKQLRKERKLTLSEVGKRAGLSVSFLSQIENGKSALMVVTLNKIANALEVPMTMFFTDSLKTEEYVRNGNEQVLKGMQHNYKNFNIMSGRFEHRIMDAFRLVMKPNFEEFEEVSHEGEEFYYVLRGTVTIMIDHKEHVAKEGESIHFPAYLPHKIMNKEDVELEMISVITPTLF